MPDTPESCLTLRQADQARTDFAIIKAELEAVHAPLARMPTLGALARAALGIIFCTAVVTNLFGRWLMAHRKARCGCYIPVFRWR